MAAHHKWDTAYLQDGFYPPFAKKAGWSNYGTMEDNVDIDSIRSALKRAMEQRGAKPTTLSLKIGTNRTLVRDLLERNSDIKLSTLTALAGALDVPLERLLMAPPVPVVGFIGAGGIVLFEEFETGETAPRPPAINGKLEALIVRGTSMLPKYRDGDIIYIQRHNDGVLEDCIGDDCAVRITTGETYIKQLIHGSAPGLYTLLSLNAPPIENVEVEWATRVVFIMPARSRDHFS